MYQFFVKDINDPFLDEAESKHALKVLRLSSGNSIELINGKGSCYQAKIIDTKGKKCAFEIFSEERVPAPKVHIHIAIAPTKNNERLEWFLEKATEIGIQEISPIICEHSERKTIKEDRFEKILLAAMKQSKNLYLPQLNELSSFKEFITTVVAEQKFIAHCQDSSQKKSLKTHYTKGKDVCILIGPEGDFSEKELTLASKYGFSEISLGNSRLRTETAGLVACQIINFLNE